MTTQTIAQPHEYEDALIDAVYRQALVLLLIEPHGTQHGALKVYAEAARLDLEVAKAEVADLAMKAARERDPSRLPARAVVGAYIDYTIKMTAAPLDDTPPTRIEQDVCRHCRRPIERTDVRPTWRHLEGRTGSPFCGSPLDSTVATPEGSAA